MMLHRSASHIKRAIPVSAFGIKVEAAPYLTGVLCPDYGYGANI